MDFLNSFPKARIVFNSRHPDSVCKSGWFKNRDPEKVRAMILACDQRFEKMCDRTDRCIHMKYEDYTGKNWRWPLEEMFAFLDIPFNADRMSAVLKKPLIHAQPRD